MTLLRQYILFPFWLVVLAFFLSPSTTFAKLISFDTSLSEFVLKNSNPLISQTKAKSGLGYQSLKNQIISLGCDPSVLMSQELLNQTEPYAFHQALIEIIEECTASNLNKPFPPKNQKNLVDLLENKDVYLIIAGESLNSPMSYFGHSLLLFLDKSDFYFSPVISVLAPTDGLGTFDQIARGGFSSIKAELNAIPLHQVLSYYNNQESRSLRFIKLPEAVFNKNKILSYFDEQLSDDLTYNFFLDNCSTYLYQALDYACNCFDASKKIIAPTHIEREVLLQEIAPKGFELASLFDQFNQDYDKLSSHEQYMVRDMVLNSENNLSKRDQTLGDVTVLASRLRFETYHRPYDSYSTLLDTYGKEQSLLESIPDFQEIEGSKLDKMKLSSASVSFTEKEARVKISAVDYDHFKQRQKNHILSKLSAGVIEISNKNEETRIEKISLINIKTIIPIDFVTQKVSWRFKIGGERDRHDDFNGIFSIGAGPSFSISGVKLYSLPSLEISSSTDFSIYSGLQFETPFLSIKYENKNLNRHEMSFFKRSNSFLGYEYSVLKERQENIIHRISVSYFF